MIDSFEWVSSFWSHRMQLLLCWSVILPLAWLATVGIRKLSPPVRSWIWRLAYLKLLLVFVSPLALELPLRPFDSQQQPHVQQSTTQSRAAEQDTINGKSGPALQVTIFSLMLAWCSGVLYLTAKYFAGWKRVYRLVSEASRCPNESRAAAELRNLQDLMSLNTAVELRVSRHLVAPFVFGVLRPTIVIPQDLHESDSNLRAVLAHELAHVARRDLAWNLVHAMVGSTLFFHPFIWLFQRDWRLSQELACDEITLVTTKSSFVDYAALILRLSRPLQIPSLPSSAVGVSEFSLLKRRLMMLRNHSSDRFQGNALVTLALVCVSVVLLVPWQPVYGEKGEDTSEVAAPVPVYREGSKDYRLTVRGLLENADEYVPSFFIAKGIGTTMSVGPESKHVFTVGSRKGGKVKLTCLWEQQVSTPRSVEGQLLWTSNFTAFSRYIELGKKVSLELVSPSDSGQRKMLSITVDAPVSTKK